MVSGAPRIAVVSMALRFAGARDPAGFASLLEAGVDASRRVDPARFPAHAAATPARGYYLDADASAEADVGGLGLDALFGLTLGVGREAFFAARHAGLDRRRVGIVLGNLALPTTGSSRLFEERLAGLPPSVAEANAGVTALPVMLLGKKLGLGGATFALDAACASSLYAIHLAVQELAEGRADAMLAGGVAHPDAFYTHLGFSRLTALAPDGVSRPFDERASGLVVGEGAGIFMLKRLDDALRDGDRILGVIAGAGISNDLDGGMMAPSAEGQLRALRSAYRDAGWDPRDVDFVEAHATGTPLGDAVEVQSLKTLWQEAGALPTRKIPLGSVKANVGHLLTAAGASSLAKALLAIERKVVAPTANFKRAAPRLGLEDSGFEILRQARRFTARKGGVRAAISGFGFGGINAHLLVEEYRPEAARSARTLVGGPAATIEPRDVALIGLATLPYAPELMLDAALLRIPPAELQDLNPQQILALATACDAGRSAGLEGARRHERAGVFLGIGLDASANSFRERPGELTAPRVLGNLASVAASRIVRAFGLGGMGYGVAAEAQSGVRALGLALLALERGELDLAFAGDVTEREATMFVLKDLAGARAAGDDILAIVARGGKATDLPGAARAVARLAQARTPDGDYWLRDRVSETRVLSAAGCRWSETSEQRRTFAVDEVEKQALFLVCGPSRHALSRAAEALFGRLAATPPNAWARVAAETWEDCTLAAATGETRWRLALFWKGPLSANAAAEDLSADVSATLARWRARVAAQTAPCLDDSQGFWLTDGPGDDPPRLALLFPGAGSHYQNMGRQLAATFPALIERQDRECTRLRTQWGADTFWSAAATKPAMTDAFGGPCALAAFVVDLLRHFGVEPDATVGYSLGESAALIATRAWRDREAVYERLRSTDIFTSQLAGPMLAARRHFALKDGEPLIWANYLVRRPPDEVRAALAGARRVYLNNVNAPRECIIGGDDAEARQVLKKLRHAALELPAIPALHCPVVSEIAAEFQAFHEIPFAAPAGLTFYGGAHGEPIPHTSRGAAEAILAHAWHGVDFPKVIERAYADGVRVFVEVGPGAGLTRLVREILGDRPHAATSACAREGHEVAGLFGALALAFVHGRSLTMDRRLLLSPARAAPKALVRVGLGRRWRPILFPKPGFTSERSGDETEDYLADEILDKILTATVAARTETAAAHAEYLALAQETSRAIAAALVPPTSDAESAIVAVTSPPNGDSESALGAAPAPPTSEGDSAQTAAASPSTSDADFAPIAAATPSTSDADLALIPAATASTSDADLALIAAATPPTSDADSALIAAATPSTLDADSALIAAATLSTLDADSALIAAATLSTLDADSARVTWDLSDRAPFNPAPAWLNFQACQTIARGQIGDVLGPAFAAIDAFPTRVRLPDGPLLLCHRIMSVDAVPLSLSGGVMVTEHDVHADAWYLDDGRIPTCVAVEAGQADLFLSGYLGIDFRTEGRASYRLLDAVVTFHDRLPEPGATIRYEITIHEFFEQSGTTLFRFSFVATVGGARLITMEQGSAGFFSAADLAAGRGIVKTALDLRPVPGKIAGGYTRPVAMQRAAYDDAQLEALRAGDYARCFGPAFAQLTFAAPKTLPSGMLRLVHRVLELEPDGGRFGLGLIRGEADIRPDDWFLTCHFIDDQVMPGTLMYECCNHTLRIFLLRSGWIGEAADLPCEPLPGVASRLKCRGQVLTTSRKVEYRIEIKEIGYGPDAYAIADALMLVDGRPIVEILDMSVRHAGLSREKVEETWRRAHLPVEQAAGTAKSAIYGPERILAFSSGNPSAAFGEPYAVFDTPRGARRRIARLPRPPYQFLDRITGLGADAWKLEAGGWIEAQYDVPPDAWYFAAAGATPTMPLAVLLEIALQPCGWYSAYMGSALAEPVDLAYRNLSGKATQLIDVTPESGTLTTLVRATKVSHSAGMIIQSFEMVVSCKQVIVYRGETMFGFFTQEALAQQVGLRGVARPAAIHQAALAPYPDRPALPRAPILMIDEIVTFTANALHGRKRVNPAEWFFEAHFFEDPVMPGSLGLEACLQLLMLAATERWPDAAGFRAAAIGVEHAWTYRGQVVPRNAQTDVYATVTAYDDERRRVVADGLLAVDGLPIYEMKGFAVEATS